MKTWLFYPPFADPTQPYHALPSLKGYLRARGLDAVVVDLNVEAAHFLLDRRQLRNCADRIAARYEQLNDRPLLSGLDQMEYLALARARPAALNALSDGPSPVRVFMDTRHFYDLPRYRQARDQVEAALECISAAHFPYRFHFNQAAHVAVPWGKELLTDYCRREQSPLDGFYRRMLKQCPLAPGDVAGISLTFVSQIPESFYLMHLLRRIAPQVFILAGGSCLQQMMAHAPESMRHWVMTMADGICLFEGEETLAGLLQVLDETRLPTDEVQRYSRLCRVPNLLLRDPPGRELHVGPMRVTDMKKLPPPDFSDLNLDRYLAPSRTLLFAPTRGCHWNRCTFCDYGLSRSGRHAYRQMEPAAAADQLLELARQYDVKNFYLAVDVLSPQFARQMAETLVSRQAAINWSADFRIDSRYTPQHCEQLRRSGLRAVAFGVESGSDRVLRIMNKGIDAASIRSVNARFQRAGIATAWMAFSGHPGETAAEALETIRLIESQQTMVDLFILGRFGLTSGAHIAAHPQEFGLRQVFYCRGDDFHLFPLFTAADMPASQENCGIESALEQLSKGYYLDHYPWAGAVSTHHSMLYLLKFGPGIFRRLRTAPHARASCRPPAAKGLLTKPAFDLQRLRMCQERFFGRFWTRALAVSADGTAPLSMGYFNQSLEQIHPFGRSARHG